MSLIGDSEPFHRRSLDRLALRRHAREVGQRARRLPLRPRAPPRCTNSPGTSSATGISSSPNPSCRARSSTRRRRSAARAARSSLMLEALLRALHPMMPFITEEIWQRVRPLAAAVARRGRCAARTSKPWTASWLSRLSGRRATTRAMRRPKAQVGPLKEYILKVRQIRGEMNIAPSRKIPLLVRDADEQAQAADRTHAHYLHRLAGLEIARRCWARAMPNPSRPAPWWSAPRCWCPWPGLIDAAAEIDRLSKVIAKNESDIGKLRGKLAQRKLREERQAGTGRGRSGQAGRARGADAKAWANNSNACGASAETEAPSRFVGVERDIVGP